MFNALAFSKGYQIEKQKFDQHEIGNTQIIKNQNNNNLNQIQGLSSQNSKNYKRNSSNFEQQQQQEGLENQLKNQKKENKYIWYNGKLVLEEEAIQMYENDCQEINEKILPIIQRGMVEKTVIPASQKEYEYFLIEEWKKYKGNLEYLIKERNQLGPDSFVWWNNYKLKYSKLRQIFITQKKDNKFQQYIKDLRQYENDLFETCCNLIQDYQQNYNQNREFNYNANRYRKKQILKEIDYLVSKTQEFEQQSRSNIQIPLENSIITYSNAPTKDQSDQNNMNNRGSLESSQNNQQQNQRLGEVDIQKKQGRNQGQKWQNQVEQLQQSSRQKGVSIQSIYNFSGHCGTSSKKSQKYQSKTMVDGSCQGKKKIRVKNNNNKNNNNNFQHIYESDDTVEEQSNYCSQFSEGKNRNKSCSLQNRGKDGRVRENFEENLVSEGQVFRSVEINEYKNYSQNNNSNINNNDSYKYVRFQTPLIQSFKFMPSQKLQKSNLQCNIQ